MFMVGKELIPTAKPSIVESIKSSKVPSSPERTNRRKERGDFEVFLALIGGNDFLIRSFLFHFPHIICHGGVLF